MPAAEPNPARTEVARALLDRARRELLQLPPEQLFGSEESLLARHAVSRPTLREVLGVLINEGLIEVRRGPGGGYFVSRPDGSAVTRLAAIYLGARQSTISEAVTAFLPVRNLVARLASRSANPELREQLGRVIEEDGAVRTYTPDAFAKSEREVLILLARMCGNGVLDLILQIVISLSAKEFGERGVYRAVGSRVARMRRERGSLLQAIYERDEELAQVFSRRCTRLIVQWMREDGHEIVDLSE